MPNGHKSTLKKGKPLLIKGEQPLARDLKVTKKKRSYKAPDTLLMQNTTLQLHQYVQRLVELGAAIGGFGKAEINPKVKPINEAFHHILAGGEVKLELINEGDPSIVEELDALIDEGYEEANRINKKAGYRLTMEL